MRKVRHRLKLLHHQPPLRNQVVIQRYGRPHSKRLNIESAPLILLRLALLDGRNNSGSLAIFTAIRRFVARVGRDRHAPARSNDPR